MNSLQVARKKAKLTQLEAANRIGISYSMLSKMESGFKTPSLETMEKVANFYGETVDDLFFAHLNHSK